MERLAVKKTGPSEYVVILRSDGRAVTIDKVLTAASGRDTKQFWNVVAQHQTKGVRDHKLSCERGFSRALCKNFQKRQKGVRAPCRVVLKYSRTLRPSPTLAQAFVLSLVGVRENSKQPRRRPQNL